MSIVELHDGTLLARFSSGALVLQLESGRLLSFPERLTDVVAGLIHGERASDLERRYAVENGTPRYRAREIVRAASRAFSGMGTLSATMRVDGKSIGRELGRVRVHHLSSRSIDEAIWKAALALEPSRGLAIAINSIDLDEDPVDAVAATVLFVETEHPPAEWVRLFYAAVARMSGGKSAVNRAQSVPSSRRGTAQSANDQRR